MNKIVLLEGPDASGKSFLAKQIMEKYPNHVYIHNAVTDDITSLHKNTIEAAKIASEQHTVIIDRLHLSEKIYGNLFRKGPSYNTDALDAALDSIPNLIRIMCMVDKETSVGIHSERNADGKEMFNINDTVWDRYNEECKHLSSKWIVYNWKEDELDLDSFRVKKYTKLRNQAVEFLPPFMRPSNEIPTQRKINESTIVVSDSISDTYYTKTATGSIIVHCDHFGLKSREDFEQANIKAYDHFKKFLTPNAKITYE